MKALKKSVRGNAVRHRYSVPTSDPRACSWRFVRQAAVWGGILLVLSGSALAAQTSATSDVATMTDELAAFKGAVRAKYDLKEEAFRNNDVEPIINGFYSERVISVDPEGNTHIGRDGIRPVYEEVIGSLVTIESFQSFVNGDAGWDWVNFHVSFPPGVDAEPFSFKMLFLWERIEGEWWSHGEMYVPGAFALNPK